MHCWLLTFVHEKTTTLVFETPPIESNAWVPFRFVGEDNLIFRFIVHEKATVTPGNNNNNNSEICQTINKIDIFQCDNSIRTSIEVKVSERNAMFLLSFGGETATL